MAGVLAEEETNDVVVAVWSKILQVVNAILDANRKFGFSRIEANLNPTLADIVHSLTIVDGFLSTFMDSDLNTDDMRKAINAKQCVLHIRMLHAALQAKDRTEYARIMDCLEKQAPI